MRFSKSYWLAWFGRPFLAGFAALPLSFFGWGLYSHFSTIRTFQLQGIPAALVTNPFIEITNPRSGEVVASGGSALVIAALACGAAAGVLGLVVASAKCLIRRSAGAS